jgi:hypothetical protein
VASLAWVLFLSVLLSAGSDSVPVALVWNLIVVGVTVFLLTRLGLLYLVVTFVFVGLLLNCPLTTQGSAWYAGISLAGVLLIAALAIYGFYTSMGGQKVFEGKLLED